MSTRLHAQSVARSIPRGATTPWCGTDAPAGLRRPRLPQVASTGRLLIVMSLSVIPACTVAVDPAPAYAQLSREVAATTGAATELDPGARDPLAGRVDALLRNGLSSQEAVELGLLLNPTLQAEIHTVGQAVARRVQAGLMGNPSFQGALRFPAGGGAGVLELGLLGNLLDLWQLDEREAVAAAELERRILEVAGEAARLAADIRAAYVETVASSRLLALEQEGRQLLADWVALVEAAVGARAAPATELDLARLQLLDADIAWSAASLRATEARRQLLTLVGLLHAPPGLALDRTWGPTDIPHLDPQRIEALALERRFEVRAARAHLEQSVAELERQEGLTVRILDVGLAAERDGDWSLGPGVSLELPLFDRNQAGMAEALEQLAEQAQRLAAAQLAVVHDVVLVLARLDASRQLAATWEGRLGALADDALSRARRAYEQRQTTLFPVIQLQRDLLGLRRALVQREAEIALALSELERATGTDREGILGAATPADQEPETPTPPPTPDGPAPGVATEPRTAPPHEPTASPRKKPR